MSVVWLKEGEPTKVCTHWVVWVISAECICTFYSSHFAANILAATLVTAAATNHVHRYTELAACYAVALASR